MITGIVGLKQVGKTTIFNLLTGAGVDTGFTGKREANIGIVHVPDERLLQLSTLYEPRKTTYATVQFVDMPGVEPNEMKDSSFLSNLRQVDSLLHVVRAFHSENIPHPAGNIDPLRDIENMELEMIMSDLFQAERRLERLEKDLRKAKNEQLQRENKLLLQFKAYLEKELPLRELSLNEGEEKIVRGFTFLTQKPILHVINLDDNDAEVLGNLVDYFGLSQWGAKQNVVLTGVCGKIEEELMNLTQDEARDFMEDLGLKESGLERIIKEVYSLLGLISFFTVGKDEVRAWTVRRGTHAQDAAGVIHTDIARGFIRAEVVRWEDLIKYGSFQALKEKGLFRLEGKDYVVKDGDVVHFRFNV